jgi:thymidylate synthase ThyX
LIVYALKDNKDRFLHPSVQATILAKYSRSPESARTLVDEISEEEADLFHEKWVINYGHSSVAELATIPLCFEGVSMVASKFIESFQRAGYSEKSTRYQHFTSDSFVLPPGAPDSARKFCKRFYDAYEALRPEITKLSLQKFGLEDTEKNRNLAKVKARTFDVLRYLLPAGTGTNLAAVMNLRDVRYMVSLGRASSNPEIRNIAEAAFLAASKECPGLLKEATPDFFELPIKTVTLAERIATAPGVEILDYDPEATRKIVDLAQTFYGLNWEEFSEHMATRKQSQIPSVFKNATISFVVTMDYGAYRDLQRHRRCEQFAEPLTPWIGYDVPDDIIGTQAEIEYRRVMDSATNFDEEMSNDPTLIQYIVPMGYLHRSIFRMDIKELYYMAELRTKPQGHISYRRIAYQMFEKANRVLPELMKWCKVTKPDEIGAHL